MPTRKPKRPARLSEREQADYSKFSLKLVRQPPTPQVLRVYQELGYTDSALADVLGVSTAMVAQWRTSVRPIPRRRRIQVLALLAFLQDRLTRLSVRERREEKSRACDRRDARKIATLQRDEIRARRRIGDFEAFVDELAEEAAHVAGQLGPTWDMLEEQEFGGAAPTTKASKAKKGKRR